MPLCGGLSAPLLGALCKKIGRPAVATIALFSLWLAISFLGPTDYLFIPPRIWTNLLGFVFGGIGLAGIQITTLIEIGTSVN